MTVLISKNEMRLLGYLHEHAKGFDQRSQFKPDIVAQALRISLDQLNRDSSFLASHSLAGVASLDMSTFSGVNHKMVGIWLTGDGENLMRHLEQELDSQLEGAPDQTPGMAKRLTLKASDFVYDTAKAVIVKIVADYVTGGG
jgi:hypothetical protein